MTSTSVSPVAIPAGLSPSLFTQGVREAILVVEAARAAVLSNLADFTYVKDDGITYEGALTVTAKMMTESLSNLDVSDARLAELGLTGFMKACIMTPTLQTGCGGVVWVEWSAEGWKPL